MEKKKGYPVNSRGGLAFW